MKPKISKYCHKSKLCLDFEIVNKTFVEYEES